MEPGTENFLKSLYEEKLRHKEHRNGFVIRKLFFIIALLGIGSTSIHENVNLHFLLYFVPFVAQAYDLYIFAEDFKVKRIGVFLLFKCDSTCLDEKEWEAWVSSNREPLATHASMMLTLLSLFAAGMVLYFKYRPAYFSVQFYFITGWFVAGVLATLGVYQYEKHLKAILEKTGQAASHDAYANKLLNKNLSP